MDELIWELHVPIFKNSLILKQMGLAIGIPFGALSLFLLVMKAWYALVLIGLTFLLTFFLVLLLFRGTYDVRYVINRLNIPLRRSRDSGVAGATCPEPGSHSFFN